MGGTAWPAFEDEEAHEEDESESAKADGAQDDDGMCARQVEEVSETLNDTLLTPIVWLGSRWPDDSILCDVEAAREDESEDD